MWQRPGSEELPGFQEDCQASRDDPVSQAAELPIADTLQLTCQNCTKEEILIASPMTHILASVVGRHRHSSFPFLEMESH